MNDEEEVRRLLADARETEPMPADVQARLDAVLGDLSAERANESAPKATRDRAVVVDLSSRRRRRAKTLLIAAAAVTVLGVGVPRVLQSGAGSSEDSASSADTAAGGNEDFASGGDGALADEPAAPSESSPGSALDSASAAARPQVRPKSFAADAEAARDLAARTGLRGFTPLDPNCLAGADLLQELKSIPVRYGQLDAALVLSKARHGSQEATLYVCGESAPRRTTVLSAR